MGLHPSTPRVVREEPYAGCGQDEIRGKNREKAARTLFLKGSPLPSEQSCPPARLFLWNVSCRLPYPAKCASPVMQRTDLCSAVDVDYRGFRPGFQPCGTSADQPLRARASSARRLTVRSILPNARASPAERCTAFAMCGHPLGNNIKFHPPYRWNPSDSDLAGHEQKPCWALFLFIMSLSSSLNTFFLAHQQTATL